MKYAVCWLKNRRIAGWSVHCNGDDATAITHSTVSSAGIDVDGRTSPVYCITVCKDQEHSENMLEEDMFYQTMDKGFAFYVGEVQPRWMLGSTKQKLYESK